MAPKKGGGSSSGGGGSSGGDDEDYDYDTGTGSGSGDGDDDYDYGSGSGSGNDDGDYDYDTSSGSGSGDNDYDYGSGSGSGDDDYNYSSGDNDDYDYDYGGSNNSSYNASLGVASYGWKDPATNALFAMNIIALLALVLCMILTRRFKWIREKGTDKLRNSGYFFATFCMFLHLLIVVIRTAMLESGFHANTNFLIAFIFERLFSLIGDIMIVAIIARTILEDMGHVSFSFYAALYGQLVANGSASITTSDGSKYTTVFYSVYIFGISMYLSILACIAVIKRPSKGTFLMILIVIPSLFLRFLLALINQSFINFQSRSEATAPVGLANSFMYTFTTISIFLVVALIGGLRQRHSGGGMSQEQKIGLPGHQYVPLGPYAPPPAPYGAQAPVGQYPQSVQSTVSGQNPASGQPTQQPQQVPVSYAAQGQYVAPVQPTSTGQYAAPIQPIQFAPPAQYPAPGQFVQQQGMTTAPTGARSVSPVNDPAAYTGPSLSVSPPPPHDPFQLHITPTQH
ncbi:hypothetical protein V496_10049 [Pseudogymnoascus sp. VKM F-4515 (FW-2607)]|nr:hypothetical protein V496_10049 [Pseudogymnoascus sp. VKM F-4515 (FW-2607)]KFY90351.1 hypothetical protein V498_06022 [Pseudogymnoascus sp. VKM F-4517 (FW-2822)]